MMTAAVSAVKRAIGSKADHADALQHARDLVSDAREALAKADKRQAEAVARAREAFEADQTDENADRVAQAGRRAEIMLRGAREKLAIGEALLRQREKEALDARLAELDAIVKDATNRVIEHVPEIVQHLEAVDALRERAQTQINDALAAHLQASRLRGLSPESTHPKTTGLRALEAVLSAKVIDGIGLGARLDRLRELLGAR